MKEQRIYLDYNSTSAIKAEVKEAMYALNSPLNPSSVHSFGREAKAIIDNARGAVRKLAKAGNAEIVFTASGTEANNLALRGLKAPAYIVSASEHPSVLKVAKAIQAQFLPVGKDGIVDLKALEKILENSPKHSLVSVMLANNETGVIQPIRAIANIVYAYGGYLHCDAAQAFGKIKVDMQEMNVDLLTISAHKFGGPFGASALMIKKGIHINPMILGGGQEFGRRAGTENVHAIAGFAKACELAYDDIQKFKEVKKLRDLIERVIVNYLSPDSVIGRGSRRLPNTSSIYMPGMKAETQVINFDLEGIAVSAGAACSSGKVENSHVLQVMGISKEISENVIRVSLAPDTTEKEINKFLRVWKSLYERAFSRERWLNKAA